MSRHTSGRGACFGDLSVDEVVNRWRLYGGEPIALREAARSRSFGGSEDAAKEHFAREGLFLASIDLSAFGDPDQSRDRLIARAIRYARKALADSGPMPARFVSLQHVLNREAPSTELSTLMRLAEEPHAPTSPAAAGELRELLRAATGPQERRLIRAFRKKNCRTLADVERFYGWPRGQASVIFSRLRRKVLRRVAA